MNNLKIEALTIGEARMMGAGILASRQGGGQGDGEVRGGVRTIRNVAGMMRNRRCERTIQVRK